MLHNFAIVFLFVIQCRFPRSESLADLIRLCYGKHLHRIFRKYEKLDYRIQKIELDIQFLETYLSNEFCLRACST